MLYVNTKTGRHVSISGAELTQKRNDYNNAVDHFQQKQAELISLIDAYNQSVQRREALSAELATLTTEVSDLSSQLDAIQSELSFAKQYVESVDTGVVSTIENAITGDGDDTIRGNQANNVIDGGRGNDRISSGDGHDIIIAHVKAGDHDVITDFDTALDKIDLGQSVNAFSELTLTQDGANTLITFANGYRITLENTQTAAIQSSHFLIGKTDYLFGSAGGMC